jgi:4-amino-4-deoxy-L-arabinose transferase-like glycosyltransferase
MSSAKLEPPPEARPATGEWIAIASVLLLGGVLRCWLPSNAAVEHFDEGVYASDAWFAGQTPDHYPMRHLYAPPLLPTLVKWAVFLFGPDAPVPMLVNLIAGTATILVVWWAGRTWFGIAAGITAAALCAFSDFHILYTRTALTDPLLTAWLIAAVFCLGEGHRRRAEWVRGGASIRGRRGGRWLLAGGLLIGLAWWTKYNGWLPLAIQAAGVCGWMAFGGKDARRGAPWHLGGFLLTAIVAGVVVAPMFLGLNDVGGYAAVAENHRGYLVGWDGWWGSLQRHVGAQRFLEGYVSVFGVAYAVLWGLLLSVRRVGGRFTWNSADGSSEVGSRKSEVGGIRHSFHPPISPVSFGVLLGIVVLACGLAAAFGTAIVLAVSTLAAFVGAIRLVRIGKPGSATESLPWWILAAWFIGLLLATPLYRAYPRLLLPWLASAWLGAGATLQLLVDRFRQRADGEPSDVHPRAIPIAVGVLMLGGMLFYVGQSRFPTVRVPGWQNRGGFRPIAAEIETLAAGDAKKSNGASAIRTDDLPSFVIYVSGEPGLFFHLSRRQRGTESPSYVVAVAPENVAKLTPARSGSVEIPTYLVAGPHADRDEAVRRTWEQPGSRFRQVGRTFRYRPSDLVLLNELPPNKAANPDHHPKFAVRLFRVK